MQQVDKHKLTSGKAMQEDRRQIEAEYEKKIDEIQQERSLSYNQYTTMEKVLEEIRVVTEHIKHLKQSRSVYEDEISDMQFQRANMEIKAHTLKQKQIQNGVKLEADLKNEFEQKKQELEELQERLTDMKQQMANEENMKAGNLVQGQLSAQEKGKIGNGLNEIKELVTDILTGVPADQISPSNNEKNILELKRIIPVELSKVTHKIA